MFLAIAGTGLLAVPTAAADETIVAGPPDRFITSEVTIDQGEKVTFQNNDAVAHDVTARDKGTDGKPLFASKIIPGGSSGPVEGTEYLTTGRFVFICTLHPGMEGALNVTTAGTPVPRPGGTDDRQAPALKLKVLDSKLSRVESRGSLKVRVETDEAATVKVTAKKGGTTLAKGTANLDGAGKKTAGLKLTKAGRRAVAREDKVKVSVSARATDGNGNVAKETAKATLR